MAFVYDEEVALRYDAAVPVQSGEIEFYGAGEGSGTPGPPHAGARVWVRAHRGASGEGGCATGRAGQLVSHAGAGTGEPLRRILRDYEPQISSRRRTEGSARSDEPF